MRIHSETVNRLLALLTLAALAATVAILAYVGRQYRREVDGVVASTAGLFRQADMLASPSDLRPAFANLESLARRARASSMIRAVYVAKWVAGRTEPVVVYPWFFAAARPDWAEALEGLRRVELTTDGERTATLFLDLDLGVLRAIQIGIAVAVALIVALSALLVARIFTQQRVLTATSEVLERNERELIRLERLSLAGLLTANILHDIRKPVTNLKHELEELSEALGTFSGATRALRNMRDQVQLFFDILRDLNLERFVRADETDVEYVDINRVIEQSLRLVQYERGATQVALDLGAEMPLVLAHPYRLIQVFSNIILNAYQSLRGRGQLRLTSRAEEGIVRVAVADNGPGMSPETRDRIFEPFYSTKFQEQGSGLGLYISRTIVERLGGSIEVESAPGQGATFTISLPAAE